MGFCLDIPDTIPTYIPTVTVHIITERALHVVFGVFQTISQVTCSVDMNINCAFSKYRIFDFDILISGMSFFTCGQKQQNICINSCPICQILACPGPDLRVTLRIWQYGIRPLNMALSGIISEGNIPVPGPGPGLGPPGSPLTKPPKTRYFRVPGISG